MAGIAPSAAGRGAKGAARGGRGLEVDRAARQGLLAKERTCPEGGGGEE